MRERCQHEWGLFQARLEDADKNDPRLATPVPVVNPEHLEMSAEEKKKILDGRFKAEKVRRSLFSFFFIILSIFPGAVGPAVWKKPFYGACERTRRSG